jgi:hypothetical protein
MPLTADQIANHPALHGLIRRQSQTLLMGYEQNPRASSVFATQQRWLLGYAGLALYFRRDPSDGRSGLTAAHFLDMVGRHCIASRNTADAFLKEMTKYGVARYAPAVRDRRVRAVEPTEASLAVLSLWTTAHPVTLDALDGGGRNEVFRADPDSLAKLQPLIADGLLVSNAVRHPQHTFSLFTWLNNGGVVMDWLISGIDPAHAEADRIPTGVLSLAEMAGWLRLSRTHLARKLREAEAMGSIGWQGKRGSSLMWVSRGFLQEIATAQAVKLAIIDAAYEACFEGEALRAAPSLRSAREGDPLMM